MTTRTAVTEKEAAALAEYLKGLTPPFTVTVREGKVRTTSQNALLHKWYGEIARHRGDITASEIKGMCHMEYGLPIKMRDAQWAFLWGHATARLDYEQKCKVMASGIFACTSSMTTKELSEYMDPMRRDYIEQGVRLTDSEAQKYEGEMQ